MGRRSRSNSRSPSRSRSRSRGRSRRDSRDSRRDRDRSRGRSRSRDRSSRRDSDRLVPQSLLVRGLPPSITADQLREKFSRRNGDIRDVHVPKDHVTGAPRGFAFIEFADIREAREVKHIMDRTKLDGVEIGVLFAQERRKTPEQMRRQEQEGGRGSKRRSRTPPRRRDPSRSRSVSPSEKHRSRRSRSRSVSPEKRDRSEGMFFLHDDDVSQISLQSKRMTTARAVQTTAVIPAACSTSTSRAPLACCYHTQGSFYKEYQVVDDTT
ncbi:Aste57867_14174 [Aphanomyces stellatus]|uniref:Aste57867_14174 protein n=1 Tax=Aphanomyces stellatus TaxID=120398 RepID=A0A485L0V5_9STRA|nr:hypothetical protein As57867_014123 [Aphanomyces stellatus]VFT90999.1 Aste57867_14174 [Aphanomyces stellatus]